MGGAAGFTLGRIAEGSQNDLGVQMDGTVSGAVEVVYLEPQQHTVAEWNRRIPDRGMCVLAFPTVQLEDQLPVSDEAFVGGSPMRALTTQGS